MRQWKPHPGSSATFWIDPVGGAYHPSIVPPGGRTVDAARRLKEEFCARFGLTFVDIGHHEIPLADPRLPGIIDALVESRSRGQLFLKGCHICEPSPSVLDPHTWFEIYPGATEFKGAARASPRLHLSWCESYKRVASEEFVRAIEDAGLSGLEWLPLEESSSSDPRHWYEVYATAPIGRGLDHPVLDGARRIAAMGKHYYAPYHFAEPNVFPGAARTDVEFNDPIVSRLLKAVNEGQLHLRGPHRYVREHLPSLDFAYSFWNGWNDNTKRKNGRNRNLCCSGRARAALVKAGVLKPSRFEALATVLATDADTEIYDRTIPHPLPLPAYTPDEAAGERKRREEIIRVRGKPGVERARAPVFGTTKEAVRALDSRLAAGTATWAPLRTERDGLEAIRESDLYELLPEAWRMILPMVPIEVEFEDEEDGFSFLLAMPGWNDWVDEMEERDPEDAPSTQDLILGRTSYGDWYAVREDDPLLPADARVVHWDHETLAVAEEWPNVAAFVAHLVWMCDRAAGMN